MIKSTPIIFNTEMVQRILSEDKTQTRRTKGLGEVNENPNNWKAKGLVTFGNGRYAFKFINRFNEDDSVYVKSPYGYGGDLLWVKETQWDCINNNDIVRYVADGPFRIVGDREYKKKPSIFMSKSESRIDLLIKDIRVERLNEISIDDIRREGILNQMQFNRVTSLDLWIELWDRINSKKGLGWLIDPWVWVITFRSV